MRRRRDTGVDEAALLRALERNPELRVRFARLLAPDVLALFGRAVGSIDEPFSTRLGREPPEYRNRPKRWRADAPRIPGAVKVGRWYSVPREAYFRWLEAQGHPSTPSANSTPPPPTSTTRWTPDEALASVGLRVVGGTR